MSIQTKTFAMVSQKDWWWAGMMAARVLHRRGSAGLVAVAVVVGGLLFDRKGSTDSSRKEEGWER